MKRVIIIMAKVPRAGNVKTRLQPILDAEQRCSLAEAFLADTINKTKNLCDQLIIAHTPTGEANYFSQFDTENLITIEQRGEDLGARMSNAFDFAFSELSETNIVMIGTDSPTFPPEYIADAFASLEKNADLTLGEATDGGFYLIGLRENHHRLFESIRWSTTTVYQQITRNIADLNLNLNNIPAWYDVDEPEDLILLHREVLTCKQLQETAPQTYVWLVENQNVFER